MRKGISENRMLYRQAFLAAVLGLTVVFMSGCASGTNSWAKQNAGPGELQRDWAECHAASGADDAVDDTCGRTVPPDDLDDFARLLGLGRQ